MDADTLKTLAVLLGSAEDYKPVVKGIVGVIKSYGPNLKEILRDSAIGVADIKADCVLHFESKGFTREEAIMLTCDQWTAMKNALANKPGQQSKS